MTDRDALQKWLLGQIRQVLAKARERHPGVLPDSDLEIIAEILNHVRGDVGKRAAQ